jgi:hypothetical protein
MLYLYASLLPMLVPADMVRHIRRPVLVDNGAVNTRRKLTVLVRAEDEKIEILTTTCMLKHAFRNYGSSHTEASPLGQWGGQHKEEADRQLSELRTR